MMELKDFVKQGKESAFKDFTEQEIESIQNIKSVKGKVVAILKHIYDPEISVNIWDLGLIYGVDIVNNNLINIKMTLTSATCLVADSILFEIKKKIKQIVDNTHQVNIKLIWEPRWDKSKMSEEAKFILDIH